MMVTICILVGLGLIACGVIIACITKKGRKEKLPMYLLRSRLGSM